MQLRESLIALFCRFKVFCCLTVGQIRSDLDSK